MATRFDVALAPQGLVQAARLEGIDAPEHDHAFGAQSTQHLSELVSGKTVTLGCENERSYGRLVRLVPIWIATAPNSVKASRDGEKKPSRHAIAVPRSTGVIDAVSERSRKAWTQAAKVSGRRLVSLISASGLIIIAIGSDRRILRSHVDPPADHRNRRIPESEPIF